MRQEKLALVGANGMLATILRQLAPADYAIFPLDLPEFDLADRTQVLATLETVRPQVIVNCAAYTDVDGCETREALAAQVNGAGPGHLAEAAANCGATLVHISTDYVFDGGKDAPYGEDDVPRPLSAYGRSKLLGEEAIRRSGLERFFIVRTSWLYGPGGRNFVETIVRLASEREELRIVADQVGSPTYTGDLAKAIFALLETVSAPSAGRDPHSGLFGTYHFADAGRCSWHEFAEAIVAEMRGRGLPVRAQRILPIRTEEYPLPAVRPRFSVFSTEKYRAATGAEIPPWRDSLARYFAIR